MAANQSISTTPAKIRIEDNADLSVAVVIPSYKVTKHILRVLNEIGPEVQRIYVVDDCCPDRSGDFVEMHSNDPRVRVLRHSVNQGVGEAVMTGYRAAIDDGMDIIVKVDGDGQMNPALINEFIRPIAQNHADYTKGNRFFDLEAVRAMPTIRLFGNAVLSFMTKLSSGYWHIFDPTNGYTAIHANVARHLPMHKISRRYFFETDMLFRLNTLKAVVIDIPMVALYADEVSNLKIRKIAGEFLFKHLRNFLKRIFYNYYLRDMSMGSIQLPLGLLFIVFGLTFGGYHWFDSLSTNLSATSGTVMLSALPIIVGLQFLLAFLGQDMASVSTRPIAQSLTKQRILANPGTGSS